MENYYYTEKGLKIHLGPELGKGGEGIIYSLDTAPLECAKIYTKTISSEEQRKIELMVENPPSDPAYLSPQKHRSIAWPSALLYSDSSRSEFVGFVMPKVEQKIFKKALNCFEVTDRVKTYGFSFTWRHLCLTARNLASAMAAIHERHYCIGDLNESNVLVGHHALVSIIDCDSFQVTDDASGKTYRCTVGKPEYTAPELHGRSYKDIDRSIETDSFALAVLIFQLLMEGTHPYQAKGKIVDDSPGTAQKIIKGYFPYKSTVKGIAPPDHAPSFDILNTELQQLFLRCFREGNANPNYRPSALEWLEALNKVDKFVQCQKNKNHLFLSHLSDCPWCEVSNARGKDPFPSPIGQQFALEDPTQPLDSLEKRVDFFRSVYISMALADGVITIDEKKYLMEKGAELQIPQKEIEKLITAEIRKSGAKLASTVHGTPKLQVNKNGFEFKNVKFNSSASDSLAISNEGGGILSGTLKSNKKWLKVLQSNIDTTRHKQDITISTDATGLPLAFSDTGIIEISSNGGTSRVVVDFSVELPDSAISAYRIKLTPPSLLVGAAFGFLFSLLIRLNYDWFEMFAFAAMVTIFVVPWMGFITNPGVGWATLIAIPSLVIILFNSLPDGAYSSVQIISVVIWSLIYGSVAQVVAEIAFKVKARGIKIPYPLVLGFVVTTIGVYFGGPLATRLSPKIKSTYEAMNRPSSASLENSIIGSWKGKMGGKPVVIEIGPPFSSFGLLCYLSYNGQRERLWGELKSDRTIVLRGTKYEETGLRGKNYLHTLSGMLADDSKTIRGTYVDVGGGKGEWFVTSSTEQEPQQDVRHDNGDKRQTSTVPLDRNQPSPRTPAKGESSAQQSKFIHTSDGDFIDFTRLKSRKTTSDPRWRCKKTIEGHVCLLDNFEGRNDVILIHPVSSNEPAMIELTIRVPTEGQTKLKLSVHAHPSGDFNAELIVRDSYGKSVTLIPMQSINSSQGWVDRSQSLDQFKGENVRISFLANASGWYFEFCYLDYFYVVNSRD
jgi:serine/threonine protein kinase